ncbi:hypothetical protein AAC387_Pa09g1860 [Persea americana]
MANKRDVGRQPIIPRSLQLLYSFILKLDVVSKVPRNCSESVPSLTSKRPVHGWNPVHPYSMTKPFHPPTGRASQAMILGYFYMSFVWDQYYIRISTQRYF